MPEFSWISTDARTGRVLADLGDLSVPRVKRSICRYDSAQGTLPIPTAPENWLRATLPCATNLILLNGDGNPVYGAMVVKRNRGHGSTAALGLSTLEKYPDRRYTGDKSYTGVGQNAILADLFNSFVKEGARPGIPLRVEYSPAGVGQLRNRSWFDKDDKTIYSIATDLSGVIGGLEWTVEWEWQHNPERITPVFYIGDRIGTAATPGLAPGSTFDMPGPISELDLDEDYSDGRGANDVMATSSGQGDSRPQSRVVSPDSERPTFEERFTPSTSITETDTLAGHAQKALDALNGGTNSLSMSMVANGKLGRDWVLGDDIGFTATTPAFPNGLSGTGRAIGWELQLSHTPTVTPILSGTTISME